MLKNSYFIPLETQKEEIYSYLLFKKIKLVSYNSRATNIKKTQTTLYLLLKLLYLKILFLFIHYDLSWVFLNKASW